MKYQLVAMFDDNSIDKLKGYQRSICRKYRLYKNFPQLYIPLSTVSSTNSDLIEQIVSKILNPYKQFKIKINNSIVVNDKNKMVNIKVEPSGYMSKIDRNINSTLVDYGMNKYSENHSNIYIPIAQANYNIRKASNNSNLCISKNSNFYTYAKIDRVELWKVSTSGKREKTVVKTFNLRPF